MQSISEAVNYQQSTIMMYQDVIQVERNESKKKQEMQKEGLNKMTGKHVDNFQ